VLNVLSNDVACSSAISLFGMKAESHLTPREHRRASQPPKALKMRYFPNDCETRHPIKWLFLIASLFAIMGCQQIGLTPTPIPNSVVGQAPHDVKYYRSDEPVRLGIQRFYEGNFGLAQHYFQDAVEKAPKDATAWVGLAASYDRLGRFDLADRSYARATKLVGDTTSVLNDEGYSYMLRGELKKARAKFTAALRLDPTNPTTNNNLAMLNSSSKFIERAYDGEPCGSVSCAN
jgi:Tfp pilus assembly protein PilF